jgi:hypothetical protein
LIQVLSIPLPFYTMPTSRIFITALLFAFAAPAALAQASAQAMNQSPSSPISRESRATILAAAESAERQAASESDKERKKELLDRARAYRERLTIGDIRVGDR